MGEGRGGSPNRRALPRTEPLDTPKLLPMAAVLSPLRHPIRSFAMRSAGQDASAGRGECRPTRIAICETRSLVRPNSAATALLGAPDRNRSVIAASRCLRCSFVMFPAVMLRLYNGARFATNARFPVHFLLGGICRISASLADSLCMVAHDLLGHCRPARDALRGAQRPTLNHFRDIFPAACCALIMGHEQLYPQKPQCHGVAVSPRVSGEVPSCGY